MKKLLCLLPLVAMLVGCTENVRAKYYGGTMTINLPANTKLVNATFKEGNLWYLTRTMHSNETAETLTFKEKSNFGQMEGTVNFVETK